MKTELEILAQDILVEILKMKNLKKKIWILF